VRYSEDAFIERWRNILGEILNSAEDKKKSSAREIE
jgi:hypothetical protein